MAWSASAEEYQRHAGYVPELGATILSWLDPRPGERILDLGCGDGALTARVVHAGTDVLAVDADPSMVAAARSRGIDARRDDATTLATVEDASLDAVFSNAVLHWVRPPEEAVAAVVRVLRPGGRFVAEFGGHGNVAAIRVALTAALDAHAAAGSIVPAALPPWYFPTPASYTDLLTRHGLVVDAAELHPRPTPLPTGMTGWLDTFAGSVAALLGPAWPTVRDRAVALMAPALRDADGGWTADYVRLRVAARRP